MPEKVESTNKRRKIDINVKKPEVSTNQHQQQKEIKVLEEWGRINNSMKKEKLNIPFQKRNPPVSSVNKIRQNSKNNHPVSNEKKIGRNSKNISNFSPIFNTTNQDKTENKAYPTSSPASHHHPQGLKSKLSSTKPRPAGIRCKPIDEHFQNKSESSRPENSLKQKFSES